MTVTVISKNVGRVSEEGINDSMTLYSNKTFYLYFIGSLYSLLKFFTILLSLAFLGALNL